MGKSEALDGISARVTRLEIKRTIEKEKLTLNISDRV
jgi:hypothetical protein